MDLEELFKDQGELIKQVPHGVRLDAYEQMVRGKKIMEALLLYVNSIGRKPWRPNAQAYEAQYAYLSQLQNNVTDLRNFHLQGKKDRDVKDTKNIRMMTAAYGSIEETIETLNGFEKDTNTVEEITDQLFYWMEQAIIAGITPEQIAAQYKVKHEINLKRYASAKTGDYAWDKRDETTEL
jgi:phosphoribosyl-ATP pyrophosphohydrolase